MAHRLLHGTLHATILEADNLTNPDRATGGAPQIFRKFVEGFEETIERGKGSTQLYATVDLGRARVGQTRVIAGDPVNPRWYVDFHIYCAHFAADVVFTVKAAQPISATLIGRAYLPVRDLLDADGSEIERRLDVLDASKKKLPHGPTIQVRLRFCDVTADRRDWGAGLGSARHPGVPYTFFSQRPGCRVTLYQDAHTPDAFAPRIPLSGGRTYQQGRCWEDVFDAISDARHLVYVAGWSVYTEITLIRDGARPRPGGDATLGELLKRKTSEGVRVLMLVWDNRTFVESLGMTWGYMGTHDAVTADYFRGTEVQCVLCPRNPDAGRSAAMGFETAYMISHHQKIVAVDHDMPVKGNSSRRRIVSFVGGLDLCDGRYDTQFHSLFRTLDTAHRKDFRQANLDDASMSKGGPREPWHDIHARIEGPAAWDILYNFEQRWRKQGGDNDLLVDLRAMANASLIIPPSAVTFPDDQEAWNVQVFRSIDGGASFGFPSAPEEAARSGLVSGKNSTIDRSIQDAYIHAIRRAKRFIYIENQYFLGSSFAWKAGDIRPEEIGALHLIPRELSLTIVSKIEAGERFVVYVVVPMQAILDWQRRTMDMMYHDIATALEAKGIGAANPKDFLTFFCLHWRR